jgi:glyoxylase-like metal-dependent hydrolase (beta-lactamase superfamily II)
VKPLIIVAIMSVLVAVSGRCNRVQETSFELWAFRYGVSRFPARAVFKDGNPGHMVEFAWLFYALRQGDAWTLVDTGFNDPELVLRFGIEWTDPLKLLEKAGIKAEKISLVLCTHSHFDHIGLVDRFPKARVIISKAARNDAVERASWPRIRAFFKTSTQVFTFDRRLELTDGVVIEEIGGHSAGSSIIKIEREKIIITGDEAYLPENWVKIRTNGAVVNEAANTLFLNELQAVQNEYLILTMHDPAVVTGDLPYCRLR